MLAAGRQFPDRVWAVEGCAGIGRHIAQRLVADGETVLDVPAKLSARVRVFDTGQGRKTDPVDAHSFAVAGLRSPGLRQVQIDDATADGDSFPQSSTYAHSLRWHDAAEAGLRTRHPAAFDGEPGVDQ